MIQYEENGELRGCLFSEHEERWEKRFSSLKADIIFHISPQGIKITKEKPVIINLVLVQY